MITPAFSPTATERVLPRMALDFTTGVLDSRVTITRALNTATRVNSSGFIELVNANLPRFDYNPVTLAPKGLLIEEARTNLLTFSEQFDNAAWTKGNTTVTANSTVSPDGTSTADTLTENTANSQHSIVVASGSRPTITAVNHTHSIYVKANGRTSFSLYNNGGSGAAGAVFNLSTATVTQTGGAQYVASTITNAGNGWYRVTLTFLALAGTSALTVYLGTVVAGEVYTGDGVSGVFLYGAQTEAGAFATSYIPTTTTSVTRNADVATMTGTNFSDWFNASEGTLACEFGYIGPPKANGAVASINNNTTSNRLLSVEVGTTSGLIATSTSGFSGATIAAMVIGNTYSTSLGVNTTQFAFAYNGNATTQQAGTINATAMTQLEFGGLAGQSTRVQNIYLKNCYYYPQRLTNNEIRATSK
jgi:hypothetical protein